MKPMQPLEIGDLTDFQELLEDTISYFCDEYDMSAQLAYVLADDFISSKLNKLKQLEQSLND